MKSSASEGGIGRANRHPPGDVAVVGCQRVELLDLLDPSATVRSPSTGSRRGCPIDE
jgi:hypothetical protein